MIGLDTNVLVPCITQDDPQQSAQATQLIETRCTPATRFCATWVPVARSAARMRGAP